MAARPKLRRRRRTKIIATLGPASSTPGGARAAVPRRRRRVPAEFLPWHARGPCRAASRSSARSRSKSGRPIGILADVQGPKLRVGRFGGGRVQLQTGQSFRLDLNPTPGNVRPGATCRTPRSSRPRDRHHPAARRRQAAAARGAHARRPPGDRGGGRRRAVGPQGRQRARRGAADPGADARRTATTSTSRCEHGVDYIGLSFVQRPEDVAEAKAHRRRPRLDHGEDGEAAGAREPRRHPGADPTRSWWRAATSAWSCRPRRCRWRRSASSAPPASCGKPGRGRDADAGEHDHRPLPDPRRGLRRGDGGVRRRRRGDALGARPRPGQYPVRGGQHDGPHRRAGGAGPRLARADSTPSRPEPERLSGRRHRRRRAPDGAHDRRAGDRHLHRDRQHRAARRARAAGLPDRWA